MSAVAELEPAVEEKPADWGTTFVQGVNGVWVGQLFRNLHTGQVHKVGRVQLFSTQAKAAGTEPVVYWEDEDWGLGWPLWSLAEHWDLIDPETFETLPHPCEWELAPLHGTMERHGVARDWEKNGVIGKVRHKAWYIRSKEPHQARPVAETDFEWLAAYARDVLPNVDGLECREIEAILRERFSLYPGRTDGQHGGPRCQAFSEEVTLEDGKTYFTWRRWKQRVGFKVERPGKKHWEWARWDHAGERVDLKHPVALIIEEVKKGAEPAPGEQPSLF